MRTMTQAAPAKINLALEIRDRRPDGYHNLCSVMQTVSLCDVVTVEERQSGFVLHVDGEPLAVADEGPTQLLPYLVGALEDVVSGIGPMAEE